MIFKSLENYAVKLLNMCLSVAGVQFSFAFLSLFLSFFFFLLFSLNKHSWIIYFLKQTSIIFTVIKQSIFLFKLWKKSYSYLDGEISYE